MLVRYQLFINVVLCSCLQTQCFLVNFSRNQVNLASKPYQSSYISLAQYQSSHGDAGDALPKLNTQMQEIQTSLSRVEAQNQKKWYNKNKQKDGSSQQGSKKSQNASSQL